MPKNLTLRLFLTVFCFAQLAGTTPARGAEAKVPPHNIVQVAPGIWRIRIGEPETLTPASFRSAPADLAQLKQLPPAGAMPLDGEKMDFEISRGGCAVQLPMENEEHVYGFGLNTKLFDMSQNGDGNGGRRVFLRPTDDPENDLGESHAPVPFFVSTRGYGVFVDTARFASFYTGNVAPVKTQSGGGDGNAATSTTELYRTRPLRTKTMLIQIPSAQGVDVYIFAGPAMLDAVRRYNLFSGGGCVPPLWGLGIQYRGYSQFGSEESLALAARIRSDHMPCDVWGVEPGWQTKTYSSSFVWNTNAFPDPDEFIQKMHAAGFRLNFWQHAFTHPSSPMFGSLKPWSGNFLVWGGLTPDFATAEGRRIFLKQNREVLFHKSVDAVKLDECDYQPDSPSPWSFPTASVFPSGLDGEQMHSLFGVLYQQTMLTPYRETERRTWGLVRNSQALAASLPYVVYSDSYDHRCYVRGLANEGFSGLLWTPEVRDAQSVEDLYRRMETVIFSPQALINCWYMKNPPWLQIDRDKSNDGQLMADHEAITGGIRQLLQLRMSFVPYLYSAFMEYHYRGTPPIRALVLDWPDDPKTRRIDDQFMFGPAVLAAPMFAGQKARPVYLPKGDWYDFWTHQKFAGGQMIEATNGFQQIPLYVKSGSLLPLAEPVESIKPDTSFDLTVNAFGPGPAECLLYEDDGDTVKTGEQTQVRLQWNDAGHTVERTGEYKTVRYQVSHWTRIE